MSLSKRADKMPFQARQSGVELGVLRDQLADLRESLLISMPISTILSVLVVIVKFISGFDWTALVWLVIVNAINAGRILLALKQPRGEELETSGYPSLVRWLRGYMTLAFLAGIAWAYVAVLADGFTAPETPVYLVIVAGISAGSVSYSACYAALPILFMAPPLLSVMACMVMNGGLDDYVLAFTTTLFFVGLTKSSFLGQARFRETSRLKYETKLHADEMEKNSREDPLTGLLNRRGLEQLARVGGDEFALMLALGSTSAGPEDLATRIIASISRPYAGINSIQVGASIGIYVAQEPALTNMLLRADFALYAAKRRSRNQLCIFDAELENAFKRQQCIERDLKAALESGELQSWYQPIVRLETREVVGFESLLRWQHPEHGAIAPPEIITTARTTGLLPALTETVFWNGCTMMERLGREGRSDIRVAINISPRELEAADIDTMILEGLAMRGLPPSMLEIEITEEAPVDPEHVGEKLARLAQAGISIVLDDFGSGFSTLASLRDGRISKIKIDRSFADDLAGTDESRLLMKAIVDLAHTLDIQVMAEGVEAEDQAGILQSMGCTCAQGFLFSPALPIDEALTLRRVTLAAGDRALP
jgi:EAL domain-containing protein (putative c-di-GMP-specific phosphodiesterase class I)